MSDPLKPPTMSPAPYTVVAFCTREYADCPGALQRDAIGLGLPCEIEPMSSRGNWADNTNLKPSALQRLRHRLRGPLLYLDVDTKLLRAPALPPGEWDLALAENPVRTHLNRIAAQCLFIADTEPACEFLRDWAKRCATLGGKDHGHLTATVAANRTSVLGTADFAGCLLLNGLRPERTVTPS